MKHETVIRSSKHFSRAKSFENVVCTIWGILNRAQYVNFLIFPTGGPRKKICSSIDSVYRVMGNLVLSYTMMYCYVISLDVSSPRAFIFTDMHISKYLLPILTISLCRIYLSVKRVTIGSDNSLSPMRRQTIISTNWTLRNKVQCNFNQNTTHFIHEKLSENILW